MMDNPRPMNVYEKVVIPVAVAGILGGLGLAWSAIMQSRDTALILERVERNMVATTQELKELRQASQSHETRITVLEATD